MEPIQRKLSLSLQARLTVLLAVLMAMSTLFCGLLILQEHNIATRSAGAVVASHERMARTSEMREILSQIAGSVRTNSLSLNGVAKFNQLLNSARADDPTPEIQMAISAVDERFTLYLQSLGLLKPILLAGPSFGPVPAVRVQLVRDRLDGASASIDRLVGLYQSGVFRTAEGLRRESERSLGRAAVFLLVFIIVTVWATVSAVGMISRPVSVLIKRLDELNPEMDLPDTALAAPSGLPEVEQVARSFDRLLQRLRGYRALNIRRLLLEKRRADILAATITDGIILLRNDEIVYANPTGEQILGLTPGSAARGLKLSTLIDDRALARSAHASEEAPPSVLGVATPAVIESSGPKAVAEAVSRTIPTELALTVEDRKAFYLIQASRISFDMAGDMEGSLEGLADHSNERDSDEITRMLARFQANTLVVAQDVTIVKESQEAKGHFLATLSHEIKTPVTSLTMATRLLRKALDQIPNPTHRSLIQTCADDVDRLRRLLDDLLTTSRFDTLTQKLEVQNIDLAKLVRHSVQSFQVQAAERSIELSSKILGTQMQIFAPMDPAKVAWALSNLLTNALRHTPRGGRVHAWIEASDEWVKIGIQDSGPGIDHKRQDRIFDKFNPYYDLRVARTGSTGMGLAIAKEIVVAHGGRIWVSSEPGCGAEFCFTLPLKRRSGLKTQGLAKNEGPSEAPRDEIKGALSGTPARS